MRRVFGPEGLFERDAQRLGHSLAVCRVGIVAVARVALLDEQLGIAHGDTVKVSSNRGYIKAKAVVTKRIRTLKVDGKDIDTIGIPIHWGYEGVAKKGFIANTLTPFVGDANTQTPEFKSFLVNVEKV